jgi:hypothetical protein
MTQGQWLSKLQSFVPDWLYVDAPRANALLDACAATMADHDAELDYLSSQMFIETASGAYLDLWGRDRGVTRNVNESDDTFRIRVQTANLRNLSDKPDLLSIVNSLLIRGQASMSEDSDGSLYLNRSQLFLNRNVIEFATLIKDAFTILIDKQIHAPFAFESRAQFVGRSTFIGTTQSSPVVFQNLIQAINDNRAFGALYRIVERTS